MERIFKIFQSTFLVCLVFLALSCSEEENSHPVPFTFEPKIGKAGSIVTIKSKLDLTNAEITFRLNLSNGVLLLADTLTTFACPAKVIWTSSSGNEIKVFVPDDAASGPLYIATPPQNGIGTMWPSIGYFIVVK